MMVHISNHTSLSLDAIVSCSVVADMPGALATMQTCLGRSREVCYGTVGERLVAVWGLVPPSLLSNQAWMWMLTTKIAAQHKFLIVRHSQRWVEDALERYDALLGDVVVGNDSAVRWLRWLGAKFGTPEGRRIPFVIRRRSHG